MDLPTDEYPDLAICVNDRVIPFRYNTPVQLISDAITGRITELLAQAPQYFGPHEGVWIKLRHKDK